MSDALAKTGGQAFSLTPTSLEEALKFSKILADSDLVPKDYKGKPGNVLVAMQMGLEVGLQPLQALQNIAVINGRAAIWGDAMLALVKTHVSFEWIDEKYNPTIKAAICTVKRKGQPEQVRTFSEDDAKKARLWEKDIWKAYPQRMLQMRARAFALRDVFPDAIKGLAMAEEAQDFQELDVTPKPEPITTPAFQVPAMPKVEPKVEAKAETPKVIEAELVEPEVSAPPKNEGSSNGRTDGFEPSSAGSTPAPSSTKQQFLERITKIANRFESDAWLKKWFKEIAAHPDKEEIMDEYKAHHKSLLADEHGKEGPHEEQGEGERNFEVEMEAAGSLKELQAIWTACVKAIGKDSPEYPHLEMVKNTCKNNLSKE